MIPKKALKKDIIREISKTRSRFISIFVMSALAVAFLAGLRTTAPDMEATADLYLDEQNMMDIEIISTLGLTEEDIAALSQRDGVLAVEGSYTADGIVPSGDNDLVVKILSISEQGLNTPNLLRGRMPQNANECLVEESMLEILGADLGDSITINTGTGTYEDALKYDTFTVVGTCQSPLYLSLQRGTSTLGTGSVSCFVMLKQDAFDMEAYTEAYLTLDGAKELNAYSDEYETLTENWLDANEQFGETRAQLRSDSIRGEAEQELADAQQQYDEAEAEVNQELADAAAELADARQELDDGWAEYYQGQIDLEDEVARAEQELADGEQELADAYIELTDGEAEYADGLAEYQDGLADYNEALDTYEAGRAELDAGWDEYYTALDSYNEGVSQLENYRSQLSTAESTLRSSREELQELQANPPDSSASEEEWTEYNTRIATLQATISTLETNIPNLNAAIATIEQQLTQSQPILEQTLQTLEDSESEMRAGKAELDAAEDELNDARSQIEDARQELDDGWAEYHQGIIDLDIGRQELIEETANAKQELADAYTELTDGEAEYADGLAEYQDGKAEAEAELADARSELRDAQHTIDEIEDCEWYILSRQANAGFVGYQQDAERMSNLATVFPIIFFLVAALVCLTTMTRMVEEQRNQIGCLDALGYSKFDIARKYVVYGLFASLSGSLVGLALGCTFIPWVIITAWRILYNIPGIVFAPQPDVYIMAVFAAVACNTVAVIAAAINALRSMPATLMRPRAPKPGKRVFLEYIKPLWSKLSFSQKVAVRNLFRYKKRFWMTVIGIAGCTALIVTGFGIRDSILDIMDLQYDEIYGYQAQASLIDNYSDDELQEVIDYLDADERIKQYLPYNQISINMEGERTIEGYLFTVADGDDLEGLVELRTRQDHQPVTLSDDGLVLTEKAADLLGVDIGDTLTIVNGDTRVEAAISAITENYVMHYAYITDNYYQQLFGEAVEDNSILISFSENAESLIGEASSDLLTLDAITSLSQLASTRDSIASSMESIDYAVVIIIVCAAALAFVVLYNLTNINITERIRELATLKVLGFNDREMGAFVYRENVCLTLLGVILGLIMGKFVHQWLVMTIEIDMVMFGRSVQPISYLYAVLLTLAFSLIVNIFANRKLRKIDMVESLKSVE